MTVNDKQTIITQARKILLDQGPLESAVYLARFLFWNKKDQGGRAVMGRLHHIAEETSDPQAKPAGYLRAVVKDAEGWTGEDLHAIGFDQSLIDHALRTPESGDPTLFQPS